MRNATINWIYEGTNRIQRVVIVAGVAALILAAFGLDSVPQVGGLGAPAFAASSPDDGVLAPYGRRRFRGAQRAGWE